MRIVFLGDSLTWGGYGGNFVDEVAQRLPEHEIINAGEGGNTVVNLLNRLDNVLDYNPDGIFVMVGGNDAISYSQPETRIYYQQAQGISGGMVSPELFVQTYRELLTRIQLEHIITWMGLEPTEYNSEIVATFREYNALAQEEARTFNIPVLDLIMHFSPIDIQERPSLTLKDINEIGRRIENGWDDYENERQRQRYAFTFDGLHLMPGAATQVAELIVEFLNL